MICFPNAKINLGLDILGRRPDGFHEIETFLFPIPLFDVLEFRKSDAFKLFSHGYDLEIQVTDNLVFKTWQLLKKQFSIPPLEIHLIKNIPAGSGLGGGSSDAAFLIKNINSYFSLKLNEVKMQKLASQLGSDCPFFIQDKPAFASGRGEIIEPFELILKGFYLVLVFPKISVSTSTTYKLVKPLKPENSLRKIICLAIEDWKDKLTNAFEIPVFHLYPELKKIKKNLYSMNAIYVSLTGTGSCIYGIFKSKPVLSSTTFKHLHKIFQF